MQDHMVRYTIVVVSPFLCKKYNIIVDDANSVQLVFKKVPMTIWRSYIVINFHLIKIKTINELNNFNGIISMIDNYAKKILYLEC